MDNITSETLTKVGNLLDVIDFATIGEVHTVTVTLNGQHGGAEATIESTNHDDIVLVIR